MRAGSGQRCRMHGNHTHTRTEWSNVPAHFSTTSSDNREASEVSGLTLVSQPWETKSKSQFSCNSGPKHKLFSVREGEKETARP